jgi:Tol biopolymer transport system component/DNA-binding winged helix-turn-helix (wHTH) protein
MTRATIPEPRSCVFDGFFADPVAGQLHHEGRAVHVTPKALRVLFVLVEAGGQVVEKDELLRQCWPETFVEDNTLVRTVSMLRKALHQCQPQREYILTVPGRGYRWNPPVASLADGEPPAVPGDGPLAETELSTSDLIGQPAPGPQLIRWRRLVALAWSTRPRFAPLALVAILACLVGSSSAWLAFSPDSAANAEVDHSRRDLYRLTSTGRLDTDAAWSPDGRSIAYASDRDGDVDIWVQPVAGGEPTRIIDGPGNDSAPTWSPDAGFIAFRSQRDGGGIYRVPASGGRVQRLSEFGDHPSWSPDGRWVLFSSRRGPDAGLYLVDASGSGSPRLFLKAAPGMHLDTAVWSPAGAVSLWTAPNLFETVSLDGRRVAAEVSGQVAARIKAAGVRFGAFAWLKDATALYLEGQSDGGARNIWKIRVDPRTQAWVGGPERVSTSAAIEDHVTVSPDGGRLAFTSRAVRTRAWSFPFDQARGEITGVGQPISPEGADVEILDMSPDGRKLAYTLARRNQNELWIRSLGPSDDQLGAVERSATILQPRWSHDGLQVAYFRRPSTEHTRPAVLLMSATGERRRELLGFRAVDTVYDWTRDGRSLLVRCAAAGAVSERAGICRVPLDAKAQGSAAAERLAQDPSRNLFAARYSPDERWVSFVAHRSEFSATLYVMAASGGRWIPMTDDRSFVGKPRWSADGGTVYFLSDQGGALNVWGQRFSPEREQAVGAPFEVSHFGSPAQRIQRSRELQIVVTANTLIVPVTEATGSIWVLEDTPR